ncbi:MAG: contractile injection system protein, VgrG/Pvc8 family, partial [Minicystis sp.]
MIELSFPGSATDPGFSVRRFDIDEGLSTPFTLTLLAASPDPDLDFALIVGAEARFRLDRGLLGARTWSGICASVTQVEAVPSGESVYALRLVPSLWLLSQRRNHRIFQQITAPALAVALLREWGIEATLRLDEASFPRLAYRAQRGESDLAFLSRLLEDAGVSYFFEEQEGESRLVLASAPEHAEPRAGALSYAAQLDPAGAQATLAELHLSGAMRPGAVVLGDFDFERPLYQPAYRAVSAGPGEAALERFRYAPGVAMIGADPSEI